MIRISKLDIQLYDLLGYDLRLKVVICKKVRATVIVKIKRDKE